MQAAALGLLSMTKPFAPPLAPPLTLNKWETLQSRRVDISVEWSGDTHSFLCASEASHFVKGLCPDARVRAKQLTYGGNLFRLRVEGKLLVASAGRSAYLPRRRILEAVADARALKRHPSDVYGEESDGDSRSRARRSAG